MDYNPHSPYILGPEWAALRDAPFVPDNVTEYGYVLTLDNAAIPVSGSVGTYALGPMVTTGVEAVNVYPDATAAASGPVQQVVIPVDAIWVTGAAITGSVTDVQSPNDTNAILIDNTASLYSTMLGFSFDTASYAQQLLGKRVLRLRLRYVAAGDPTDLANQTFWIRRANTSSSLPLSGYEVWTGLTGPNQSNLNNVVPFSEFNYVDLGAMNQFWQSGAFPSVGLVPEMYPWRYQELALLDAQNATSDRLLVVMTGTVTSTTNLQLYYMALEVTYCEETRILYGGRRSSSNGGSVNQSPGSWNAGTNYVPLRDTNLGLGTTTLQPNTDYLVTTSYEPTTDVSLLATAPSTNAIRQLYSLPTVQPVVLQRTYNVGDTFTRTEPLDATGIMPQVALHTNAAVVTGSHGYGVQAAAPVYGSVTANQVMSITGITGGIPYPFVRFYARRYGATSHALLLSNGAGFSVSIDVPTFDELDEIADGWKEVTLRFAGTAPFASLPGIGATAGWTFSSVGETAGNRWEVMGMDAPVPPVQSLDAATYRAPTGGTQVLSWKSPSASGTGTDTGADATLMFSQEPPAVTGVGVAPGTQALSVVSTSCGVPIACLPTALRYNQITWGRFDVCDTFSSRTAVSGFGTAESGQQWQVDSGPVADSAVANGVATQTQNAINILHINTVALPLFDEVVQVDVNWNIDAPTGGDLSQWVMFRLVDAANYYAARVTLHPSGAVDFSVEKRVTGSLTVLQTVTNVFTGHIASDWYTVKVQMVSNVMKAKIWNPLTGSEPLSWSLTVTDNAFPSTSRVGVGSRAETGVLNTLPLVASFDNFEASLAIVAGNQLEIQRRDTVDTTWQTVALMDIPVCRASFDDYEARVGVVSSYQLRYVNPLEFYGPWSATGTGTITSPGVTTVGDGNSMLMFTSNRSPSSNLAYPMSWNGEPIEGFIFPEADTQTLQRMYGRDYQVAFRPLERGGEQFERIIVVNAASIPLESLADFTGLRNLAWQDLPYVCVRDELGNRWYANVLVPAGEVRGNRTIYMAQIRVTEVTNTPAPVE